MKTPDTTFYRQAENPTPTYPLCSPLGVEVLDYDSFLDGGFLDLP
ncbi:hypothetical protein B4064_1445 [Caldibacillus thermoamylovorans]|uniref:Uncharacterized protein n=1 Tax=Caldibacillus thermoamylovorans TaxID=35841 RepID=A0A0D0GA25_9BACI|nr:hypothetical protein B4064_1445 [Caldibacillus thermoamylovorans]KIO69193.1 hypothetical protein B4065_1493 [Caldibacillus thermoamylovorans]KIO71218.1 hypothetical protein B4166_1357 [Caldibacillus thermoamylovorans]KIO74077.1 hypothetical protein B4167_1578 [Caldibacillus thermoamylovorans]